MTWLRVVLTLCVSLCAIANGAEQASIVVAPDGSGQFKSVQSAIDSIPDKNGESRTIVIKPGTYREQLLINESKTFITLRGEEKDARKTILTFNHFVAIDDPKAPGKKIGVARSETASIHADNFTAENITFENAAGAGAPAIAARTMGDKQIFRNCRFLGWQDTLRVDAKRAYFRDCYMEGRVDFIFGSGTAVFENCHVHATDGGVITAASTKPATPFGFVFLKCKVTCKEDRSYLGGPWQRGAATAFIECELGKNLWPEGWTEWRGTDNHKTARYVEYNNTGPGANPRRRPAWTRQLGEAEAKSYTVENILSGEDRWDPKK